MTIITFVFWLSFGLILYTYLGYPMLIRLWALLRSNPAKKGNVRPTVSLIIAAYNEERVIRSKIENSLALSYPKDRLEIIIVADGSTDQTVPIAREYEGRGIRILYEPERKGKTTALNRAGSIAAGDILFFSDANTVYPPNVIETMVQNFHDSSVGGVSGRKVILEDVNRSASSGETAYWTYESTLKMAESRVGSIATADGEIFAMRRSLFQPMPPEIVHDDMFLTLRIVEQGFRVVYEKEATSAEFASKNLRDEFHLKVRYASAGYQILSKFKRLWLPPTTRFAFVIVSHKLSRWLVPFFLLGVLLSSGFIPHLFYRTIFWFQVVFYSTAAAGWGLHRKSKNSVLYFPLYFCMGNAAALYGFFRYVLAGQSTLWRRAER